MLFGGSLSSPVSMQPQIFLRQSLENSHCYCLMARQWLDHYVLRTPNRSSPAPVPGIQSWEKNVDNVLYIPVSSLSPLCPHFGSFTCAISPGFPLLCLSKSFSSFRAGREWLIFHEEFSNCYNSWKVLYPPSLYYLYHFWLLVRNCHLSVMLSFHSCY